MSEEPIHESELEDVLMRKELDIQILKAQLEQAECVPLACDAVEEYRMKLTRALDERDEARAQLAEQRELTEDAKQWGIKVAYERDEARAEATAFKAQLEQAQDLVKASTELLALREEQLQSELQELEQAQAQRHAITKNAVELFGADACDKHRAIILQQSPGEFIQSEQQRGCKYCDSEKLAQASAEAAALRQGLDLIYDYAARLREMNRAEIAVPLQNLVEIALNDTTAGDRLLEKLKTLQTENKALKRALLIQLCDLHQSSGRLCPTCSESRKALGMDVKLGCGYNYQLGPKELREALAALDLNEAER